MKCMQTLIAMVVSGLVLALGSSSVVAQTVKPCVVTVVRIQGQARYSLGDNIWHPLVVGKILGAGAIIQSAVNSKVDVVLSGNPIMIPQANPTPQTISMASDPNVRGLVSYKPMVQQNVIRLFGNTVLAVDKLTQANTGVDSVSDTELDLRAGRIFFNVKKTSAASQFIIKIPNGVAGIRGSSGIIAANGETWMFTGQIIIALGNGKTYTVDGGMSFNPSTLQVTSVSGSVLKELTNLGVTVPTLYLEPGGWDHSPNVPNVARCYVSPVVGQ